MSDELRTLDTEFDENFLVIKKGIEKLDKEKESQKMQAWSQLDHKLKGLDDTLKSYRLEIYELDRGTRGTYEKKAEQYEVEIKRLRGELQFKRPASDREQLFGASGVGPAAAGAGVGRDIETMSGMEILDEGKKLQATDINLLITTNRMLETETLQIAGATLDKLKGQTEDLEKIGIDLSTIDDNLTRSTKTLKTFAKRVAADKVVWLLILLIIGGIIFAIVWGVLHPNTLSVVDSLVNLTSKAVPEQPPAAAAAQSLRLTYLL